MSPQQKQVTFGDLTITEFPIIMGYNPACQGCPITIGWGKFFFFFFSFSSPFFRSILEHTTNSISFLFPLYRTHGNTHPQPRIVRIHKRTQPG